MCKVTIPATDDSGGNDKEDRDVKTTDSVEINSSVTMKCTAAILLVSLYNPVHARFCSKKPSEQPLLRNGRYS